MAFRQTHLLLSYSFIMALWMAAGLSLRADEPREETIDRLVANLEDESPRVRVDAANELGWLGEEATSAVPKLRKALADSNGNVRQAVLYALVSIQGKSTFPLLQKHLFTDQSVEVRLYVISLLERTDPRDERVINLLIQSLAIKDGRYSAVRRKARTALVLSKSAAVPALAKVAEDPKAGQDMQREALGILMNIGPDAKDATPALIRLLRTKDEVTLSWTIDVLGSIGSPARSAIDPLMRAARESQSLSLHNRIAEAVYHIDGKSTFSVKLLSVALTHGSSRQREEAAIVAMLMRRDAAPLVPELKGTLADPGWETRRAAVLALGAIGPQAKIAVPALRVTMQDASEQLKLEIQHVIAAIEAQP